MLTRALIVPAMLSGPDDHWYPDLRKRLQAAGYGEIATAVLPEGPPSLPAWLEAIGAARLVPSEDTLVVGHSLGAVAALAWLGTGRAHGAGRYIGVGGFAEQLPHLPAGAEFVDAVDHDVARAALTERYMVFSSDDYAVPPAMSRRAASLLDAHTVQVEAAGHFLADDGWTEARVIGDIAVQPLRA
jgi:predicted alpha/beta hydrolase family esterase